MRGEGRRAAGRADRRRRRGRLDGFERLLAPRTKLVAVAHVSNALGTINPVKRIGELAHARGSPVLSTARRRRRTCAWTCALSTAISTPSPATRSTGPRAIGVLYGREALLEAMPPWQGGGDMILSVTLREDHLQRDPLQVRGGHAQHRGRHRARRGARLPERSRAGRASPPTSTRCSSYGTRPALETCRACGSSARRGTRPACSRSCSRASIRTTSARCSTTRASRSAPGHHCAQPVMDRFGVPATRAPRSASTTRARSSTRVARGIRKVQEMFRDAATCASCTRR